MNSPCLSPPRAIKFCLPPLSLSSSILPIESRKESQYTNSMMIIAPCGMNCALCMAYTRKKNVCPGCYGDRSLMSKSCAQCKIRACAETTLGVQRFCFECAEYPCARIKHIDKRYRTKYGMSMIENLENIRLLGLEAFIAREQERWKCPGCGGLICVHRKSCIYCGRPRD